jgi:uncharacterized protein YjbI with pentapeptide repeats
MAIVSMTNDSNNTVGILSGQSAMGADLSSTQLRTTNLSGNIFLGGSIFPKIACWS